MKHQIVGLDNKLINFVNYIIGDDVKITLDTELYDIIDDMDCVSFIIEIEDYFNIKISDEVAGNIFNQNNCTLKNLKNLLKENYNICDLKENRKLKISKINESNL